MAKINAADRQLDRAEGARHQADDSEVGRDVGRAIQLGPSTGLTTGGDGRRQGMQRAVAVTQASHTLMVEQVSIDTRSLRRDVGTHRKDPVRLHKQLLESAATIAGRDGIAAPFIECRSQ